MLKCQAEMKANALRVQVKVPNYMQETFLTKNIPKYLIANNKC